MSVDNSFMKFYQRQILNDHANIQQYKHMLLNIQDCYNATRIKRRLDDLEEKTTVYTDELSGSSPASPTDMEPSFDIDMGLMDEAQDQDEENFLFEEESGSPESISYELIRKYGKNNCGFDHLCLPLCLPSDSVFLTSNGNVSTNTNLPLGDVQEREYISSFNLMQLSFHVDTSRRLPPQGGNDFLVISPNGSKDSIINWGQYYGLDNEQQGAFEVATSNFVLTYHTDAGTVESRPDFR